MVWTKDDKSSFGRLETLSTVRTKTAFVIAALTLMIALLSRLLKAKLIALLLETIA